MKKTTQIFLAVAVLFSLFAQTVLAEDAFSPLKLNQKCVNALYKAAVIRCNYDSKNDPNREHPCAFWGQVEIKRNSDTAAFFFVDYAVTDAVVYAVPVYV